MTWPKPSMEKTVLLMQALSNKGERRMLFGAPCWFLGGNMFTGIFADDIFLRLREADLTEAKRLGAKPFEPVKGRVMKEYVTLPPTLLNEKLLAAWIEKSFSYVSTLPVKVGKK